MMQGKAGRYLARVGNWVEDPEWVWLKLYLDKKKTKNKRQQIKNGTVNSQNSGRSLLDSLNLQSQSGAACVWSWWLYAAADCWERASGVLMGGEGASVVKTMEKNRAQGET